MMSKVVPQWHSPVSVLVIISLICAMQAATDLALPSLMASTSPPDEVDEPQNQTTSVRRHHTISASSRRNKSPTEQTSSIDDTATPWNDRTEAIVNEQWQLGGAGAVGGGLHRQSSLPSRYLHRGIQHSILTHSSAIN
jgi:hypothetical protein